jgi:ribosomal protein S18 acetylase RimI-like enzyme
MTDTPIRKRKSGEDPGPLSRLRIRTARIDDAAAIVAVLNPIIRAGTHTAMRDEVTEADQRTFIETFPDRGVFHVAVSTPDDRIVGLQDIMPATDAHTGEISTFVALEHRGRGIGSRLMTATLEAARERGYARIVATIRADNEHAIAFYRGQGFAPAATTHTDRVTLVRHLD